MAFLVLPDVPGSSQSPPGRQSDGNKHAKRQVWAPTILDLLAKMLRIHNLRSACINEQRSGAGGRGRSPCDEQVSIN